MRSKTAGYLTRTWSLKSFDLLAEDLMALRHVPYDVAELVKTQPVTLRVADDDVLALEQAIQRGVDLLAKEVDRLWMSGLPAPAKKLERQLVLLRGLISILGDDDVLSTETGEERHHSGELVQADRQVVA